jgi:hypothetical protein
MFNLIAVAVLVVVAGWFLWSAYDQETGAFDWKKGSAGVVALGAAVWSWFTDFLGSTAGGPLG